MCVRRERLAFECTGVRLYDSLLVKCSAAEPGLPLIDVAMLRGFRVHEVQHFALVLEALGPMPQHKPLPRTWRGRKATGGSRP